MEVIKIYEDDERQISVAKTAHFCCLDLINGAMEILPQHKDALFNFMVGMSQMKFPLKSGKRCPPITIWGRFPILAPYSLITFPSPPFNIFNDAAQYIISKESLSDTSLYPQMTEELTSLYNELYPDAYFAARIFPQKFHNIKGYFVFIDDKRSCSIFWGYDDVADESEIDLDLFEEEE